MDVEGMEVVVEAWREKWGWRWVEVMVGEVVVFLFISCSSCCGGGGRGAQGVQRDQQKGRREGARERGRGGWSGRADRWMKRVDSDQQC